MPDRDDVLVIDLPDGLIGTYWIQVMNVCSSQACGVLAFEALDFNGWYA